MSGRFRAVVLTGLACLSLGCNQPKPGEPRKSAELRAVAPPASVEPALPADPAVEASITTWVETWAAVQTAGDFAAYSKLYATRFAGVKRVGSFERRFDRAGWLKDRAAMFKQPVTVQVTELHVLSAQAPILVEFQQTWSSGAYRDVGRKRLQLIEEGGLKITTEALLDSKVANLDPGTQQKPEAFSWVTPLATNSALILQQGVELDAVLGAPVYLSDERLERPVLTKALPARYRALVGTYFTVYTRSGTSCRSQVTGFKVLVEAVPHFGLVQTWDGMVDGQANRRAKATGPERALALWRLSEAGGRFLVAELDGSCPEAIWARAETLPQPKLWRARALDQAELSAAKQVIRATAEYRALQAQFSAAFAKSVPWDQTGVVSERSQAFEDGSGGLYYSLLLRSGEDDSCGSPFDVDRWYLLQKHASGLKIVSAPDADQVSSSMPRVLAPVFAEYAADLDGDGQPEFFGGRDLIRRGKSGFAAVTNFSGAFFDCGC